MNPLIDMYERLSVSFGPQHWWPAESPFEVCVGAILTQNTAWKNVEKAIANLKGRGLLEFVSLHAAPDTVIAECIRPAGYFNIKTKRLRNFLNTIQNNFGGMAPLFELKPTALREKLLAISGIGPETADSMVLYAFGKPAFVVDAYTKRILVRHSLMDAEADYFRLQEFFTTRLETNVALYNEYHALIVRVGNQFCKKSTPRCETCPLREFHGGPVLD